MKKILLLSISILFAGILSAQNVCYFTHANMGTVNTVGFTPAGVFSYPSPPYQYAWDFGDGGSSTQTNPTHTYATGGFFNVCLTIYDSAQTQICQYCDSVAINSSGFSCNFTVTVSQFLATFNASAPATGSYLSWDFADGTTGTGTSVTHTYAVAGNYNVCVYEIDSVTQNILCYSCQNVSIMNSGGGCSYSSFPDSVNYFQWYFYSQATTGTTVTWDFGDGTTGTGAFTSHTYNSLGGYYVCMTETTFLGAICTYCDSVYITGNPTSGCVFTYTNNGANSFTFSLPLATGLTANWNFGDNTSGTGNPITHVYASNGAYQVVLTVTDSNSNILCTYTVNVTVGSSSNTCQAYFASASVMLDAYFIDMSSFNPLTATYSWTFGDGGTSSLRYPTHTYASPGSYNVCLTVTGGGCTDQYCHAVVVDTMNNNTFQCLAYYVFTQISPYQMVAVNLSSGLNLTFNWDFGDGTSSTLAYPTHVYSTTGSYLLCLSIASSNGCTSSYCDSLVVDSAGNIHYRMSSGFTLNVMSPDQLTGVPEHLLSKSVSVYPNPVESDLTVKLDNNSSAVSYRVLSVTGTLVTKGIFGKSLNHISTTSWEKGIYILEITGTSGERIFQKILKQ